MKKINKIAELKKVGWDYDECIPLYGSEAFSLALSYGDEVLLRESKMKKENLADIISQFNTSDKADMESAYTKLLQVIGYAFGFLESLDPLNPPKDLYYCLNLALGALDDAVLFYWACCESSDLVDLAPFKQRVSDLLTELNIEKEVVFLCLIPFNKWRKEVLNNIPGNYRHLFAWWDRWTDVPEQAFSLLWSNKLQKLDPGWANVLVAELHRPDIPPGIKKYAQRCRAKYRPGPNGRPIPIPPQRY